MSAADILEAAKALPQEERIKLAQDFLEFMDLDDGLSFEQIEAAERRAERLSRNPESGIPWEQIRAELPESPEFIAELERRAEDALKNPDDCIPLEQVRADLKKKYGGS